MDLSIIIPVYNSEEYIEKCLNSLLDQQGLNFEILCIDDGSLDDSANIIKKLSVVHDNIKYVYQKNSGATSARNKGLNLSVGQYVYFCDADDFVEKDALFNMMTLAKETNSSMVIGNYRDVNENFDVIRENNKVAVYNFKSGDTFNLDSHPRILHGKSALWMKVVRRDIIVNNNLLWLDLKLAQDLSFYNRLLPFVDKAVYYDGIVYNYVVHSGSLSNKPSLNFLDITNSLTSIIDLYKINGFYEKNKAELEYLVYTHTTYQMTKLINYLNRSDIYYKMRDFIAENTLDLKNNQYFNSHLAFKFVYPFLMNRKIFMNKHFLSILNTLLNSKSGYKLTRKKYD